MKALAASAMVVGDEERVMLSGIIEIPSRCAVRTVRLAEEGLDSQGIVKAACSPSFPFLSTVIEG